MTQWPARPSVWATSRTRSPTAPWSATGATTSPTSTTQVRQGSGRWPASAMGRCRYTSPLDTTLNYAPTCTSTHHAPCPSSPVASALLLVLDYPSTSHNRQRAAVLLHHRHAERLHRDHDKRHVGAAGCGLAAQAVHQPRSVLLVSQMRCALHNGCSGRLRHALRTVAFRIFRHGHWGALDLR